MNEQNLFEAAKSIRKARKNREKYFPTAVLFDPAWDIIVDLFLAEREEKKISVSSACLAANVPATTALRYISKLTETGMILRKPDFKDRRRVNLELTDIARKAFLNWLSSNFNLYRPYRKTTSQLCENTVSWKS